MIKCISPVDGSTYLEREPLSETAARAAVAAATEAQRAWADRPLQERIDLVLAAYPWVPDSLSPGCAVRVLRRTAARYVL